MNAWALIESGLRMPEAEALERLRLRIRLESARRASVVTEAARLAAAVRAETAHSLRAESFLQRYSLSTQEGVVLMGLAEALLRIPDDATADALIRDKLADAEWSTAAEDGLLAHAATWGLMLTGRLLRWDSAHGSRTVLRRLVARAGEPLVRGALRQAMAILADQFIAGETIEAALHRASHRPEGRVPWRFSYDMLGEAVRTASDAEACFQAYLHAAGTLGRAVDPALPFEQRSGISIKLSALHPRYELNQRERLHAELLPRLHALAEAAAAAGIPLTLDAEETDRLVLSLELFEHLAQSDSLAGWQGLGLAVQAYQKRALAVCDWVAELARASGRRLMVRLVKGAYWDTEIKLAQVQGAESYPVFTRKAATDASYMACAQALLDAGTLVYPQFATHNCHTAAYVLECAGTRRDFEFQKLHGMGDALHERLAIERGIACRIYAPVGNHRELLAYLVRRLMENGANTSFVHQVGDESVPIAKLARDPLERLPQPFVASPRLPLPRHLFADRLNSQGPDLADLRSWTRLAQRIGEDRDKASELPSDASFTFEPGRRNQRVGAVRPASGEQLESALREAQANWRAWNARPQARAEVFERAGALFEARAEELVSLIVREAGRSIPDSVNELREAADYCRYYAARCREQFCTARVLAGPAGESNRLELGGRGVFACISPWNFPLAIFVGQVAAALAAGNAVVAKPAEQTPLVATRAVALLHQAGVPEGVLQLIIGDGETVGAPLVRHPAVAGVAFTGSFETARAIGRTLADRDGPIVPFIAETGGLNAMVVDSSALPEQVVGDAVASAFNSAGQRCSSLRVLVLQAEAADRIVAMLAGAIAELQVGDPALPATDVGPVIDAPALRALQAHVRTLDEGARLIARAPAPFDMDLGTFFLPCAYEISPAQIPRREVFGPILHVVRTPASRLDAVLDAIAGTGYGLTLGIHSRLDHFVDRVRERLPAGNVYVNRNIIGAAVGVQPFGGEGLSGTGPKAGGPNTLLRYAVERTLTVNTAATGGTPELLAGED